MITILFLSGHFWGVELVYQRVPGVIETTVGYTRGIPANPTFEDVAGGYTGHCYAVKVKFDTDIISYSELCTVFWDLVNPAFHNKVGWEVGQQVKTGIHYHGEEQKAVAVEQFNEVQKRFKKPIGTEIRPLGVFYKEADEYYQK